MGDQLTVTVGACKGFVLGAIFVVVDPRPVAFVVFPRALKPKLATFVVLDPRPFLPPVLERTLEHNPTVVPVPDPQPIPFPVLDRPPVPTLYLILQ